MNKERKAERREFYWKTFEKHINELLALMLIITMAIIVLDIFGF